MSQAHHINELETVYDELRQTNPQAAASLGVVIDRLDNNQALGPDHSKILSLYI